MSANEMLYIYVHGGQVPHKTLQKIKLMEEIVGAVELKKLAHKYITVGIMTRAKSAARYCDERSVDFVKKTILWLVKHKQTHQVRKAIEDNVAKAVLKKAILSDKPLKRDWR